MLLIKSQHLTIYVTNSINKDFLKRNKNKIDQI